MRLFIVYSGQDTVFVASEYRSMNHRGKKKILTIKQYRKMDASGSHNLHHQW